jgi:hypothetical protein
MHHHHTGLSMPMIAALLVALLALVVMLQQLAH